MVAWMVDWMVYSLGAMKVDKKDDGKAFSMVDNLGPWMVAWRVFSLVGS